MPFLVFFYHQYLKSVAQYIQEWKCLQILVIDCLNVWSSLFSAVAPLLLDEQTKVYVPFWPPGAQKMARFGPSTGKTESTPATPPKFPWNYSDWFINGPFFTENPLSPADEFVFTIKSWEPERSGCRRWGFPNLPLSSSLELDTGGLAAVSRHCWGERQIVFISWIAKLLNSGCVIEELCNSQFQL